MFKLLNGEYCYKMKTNRPNVIYILADDMGYGDVSAFNKNCAFITPNLDALCKDGMSFSDAHAVSAVCTPSRYGILTGRYNWRSRLKSGVLGGFSSHLIEDDRKTVANLFKDNGYQTAAIGKWHLGMDFALDQPLVDQESFADLPMDYSKPIKQSPNCYGFDYFYGISSSLDMPPYVYIENDCFTEIPDHLTSSEGSKFWRSGATAPNFVHQEVLPTLTHKVIEKIEEYKKDPFFIYFPMPAPHAPLLPSAEFIGKSGTNSYGDFVLMCDAMVGQIVDKLKQVGIYDNTIVIFTADNGCSPSVNFKELAEHGHHPSGKFRGHKADIYEGGHRIPLIVSWKNEIENNTECDRLVSLSDFYATMADLFDNNTPDTVAEDSVSNLPLWTNFAAPPVRNYAVQQSIDGSLTIRCGNWKLAMCPGSGGWSYPMPGKDDTSKMPQFQLFDLNKDIGEKNNCIESYPKIADELRVVLKGYVVQGRSTPGVSQKNTGAEIWETIRWIEQK